MNTKIETLYCNIIADKRMPSGNVYTEEVLRHMCDVVEEGSRIGLECLISEGSDCWCSIKVGTIKSITFDEDRRCNKLEIYTNWNIEKLLKVSALVPQGRGSSGKQTLESYLFEKYIFGSFWHIAEINRYFLNRKELLNSNYINSNPFKKLQYEDDENILKKQEDEQT